MDFNDDEFGFLDEEWKYFSESLLESSPAPAPPAPGTTDAAPVSELERLFTVNWIAEPLSVQHEFERILELLIKDATESPQEVWASAEKNESSGAVRAVEFRLRNIGKLGSLGETFFVVKMVKTDGDFEFCDSWHETSLEGLNRTVRFGVRSKPDQFSRARPD
jgi:hypothetical protein